MMTLPPLLQIAAGLRVRPRKPSSPRPKELALHMAVADDSRGRIGDGAIFRAGSFETSKPLRSYEQWGSRVVGPISF